jgi:uncharacterized protein (TIGR03437 family)
MSLAGIKKSAALILLLTACAVTPASAYYHFIHYLKTGNAPEKFDVNALPGATVTFLVSESGPTAYGKTDTWNSVLSAIQQATQVWNGVSSSALRVSFGGVENAATPQNTAGGDVIFEDLPPGIEGFGGPTSLATPVTAADGSTFFPIVRSVVHLSLNLTLAPGPSYTQGFLMTTLHEMGHSLGLQHTFTSSTMSQNTTRATTLTHPLDNDDIAGISVLYPNATFKQFGSITGRITAGGNGIHLASVVAMSVGEGAVSALTNPDGTYRIDGVPAGQYSVYVHTLPPDANVFGPFNSDGSLAPASGPVNTLFYPRTTDYSQSSPVTVTAGTVTSGIDIATSTRSDVPYYDGQVFGYLNNNTLAVTPGPVLVSGSGKPVIAASVAGLASNGQAPGLGVQIPGAALSIVPNGIVPYAAFTGFTYIYLYLSFNAPALPVPQYSPQHIVFSTPNYTYVLPSAMYLTQTPPPAVTAATANPDGSVSVSGTNLNAQSLYYFDSLPAPVQSFDPVAGVAVVSPPAGINGQQSTITIYNADGQNSQMLTGSAPVTWSYGALPAPLINTVSPSSLPAGSEAVIDITGSGFSFAQGATTVGFGTSDVLVRRVFVLSPNHLQVDVSVASGAALSNPDVSVLSGFQLGTAPAAFQIAAPVPNAPAPVPILVNPYAPFGVTSIYPGSIVSLYGSNLAPSGSNPPAISIGGLAAVLTYVSPNQINLQIPALPPGPAVLLLNNGLSSAFPVEVNIDPLPAAFNAVQDSTGAYIYSAQPAYQGETLIATMSNFAPPGSKIAPQNVQVGLGGVIYPATQVTGIDSVWQVSFQIPADAPVGRAEVLVVFLNGQGSVPAIIQVAKPDGTF